MHKTVSRANSPGDLFADIVKKVLEKYWEVCYN